MILTMKHKFLNFTFIICTFSITVFIYGKLLRLVYSEELRYELRILNISDRCDVPGTKPYISDLKWFRKGFKQYVSLTLTADKTFTASRGMLRLIRCRDLEMGCEDFQTWNHTIFCTMLKMKNQMWSGYTDVVTPKTWAQHCPQFIQGVYKIQNGTFDIDTLMKFYSEGVKYYWKAYVYVYDKKNQLIYCGVIHFHAFGYVERRHTPSVKLFE